MKKTFTKLYVIIATLIFNSSQAQNLIPNSSFENNDLLHPGAPDADSQIEDLQDWKNFNTSDWLSDQSGKFHGYYDPTSYTYDGSANSNMLHAHSGNKFIGFGPCEGAQVKLNHKTEKMHWVTVSFWFSPRGNCDTKINIYLLKDKAASNALNDCTSPAISYEVHFEVDVKAQPGESYIPGNWYFYQSEPQLATDEEYEWFAIKGENTGGAFPNKNYMYVDDVSLTQMDFCDHICTNSGGGVEVTCPPETGMVGNSGINFFATFKNANQLTFRVFDRWGCMIYESVNFDPNGLLDAGYSDFAVVWNGNTNTTGPFSCNTHTGDVYWPETYSITIDAISCIGNDYHYIGDLTVVQINDPPARAYAATKNRNPPDCCPDHKYFQNFDFYSDSRTDVDDFIAAGYSVTSGTPGNVIVHSGTDVKFFAGNGIDLQPGFSVETGAVFTATIEPCAVTPRAYMINTERNYFPHLQDNIQLSAVEEQIGIYPNPNDGYFAISGLYNGSIDRSKITITNMFGSVVKVVETYSESLEIDLSGFDKGVYFVKIECSKGRFTKKVVCQ